MNIRPPHARTLGELICPSCRQPPDAWTLASSGTCTNTACDEIHPTLAGTNIPFVVTRDRKAFLQFDDLVRFGERVDVEDWLNRLERGSPAWEAALRVGMYAELHYRAAENVFTDLYRRFVAPIEHEIDAALDLGCGVGRFTAELATGLDCPVVGLDSAGLMLRLAQSVADHRRIYVPRMGPDAELTATTLVTTHARPVQPIRWICGDVHNPPLPAASFDVVTAINLFDSVNDPALALGQASAMLRPGGWLLMAQPDAWSATATPPDRWVPSSSSDWEELLATYGLETVDREDGLEWTLSRNGRTHFRYVSQARLVRLRY